MPPDPLLRRFLAFLDASPTPHHAVATAVDALHARGFQPVDPAAPPIALPAGSLGYLRQEGSLFAFRIGDKPAVEAGWNIVAAHTDSPNLRVKPQPLVRGAGYVRLGVEVYGGAQVATWADRDLGLAGAVHLRDGAGSRTELVRIDRPVARVPTLAIHLNRRVNDEGLRFNKQTELPAVIAQSDDEDDDPLRGLLSAALDVEPDTILTWDLSLYDLTAAALGGANDEFVFSARLDNLGSTHAALDGLLKGIDEPLPDATALVALFDHEEIGSRTTRGAAGRTLESLLTLLMSSSEAQGTGTMTRALAHTTLLSADMSHAIHPAFSDKSDPLHAPRMNQGPAIKQNANHRYTTEGGTAAAFALMCEREEVPYQWFVNRSDLACGSTVGPMLSANLGVRGLDVGNPMLSMHSVREQCGAHDHAHMAKVMTRFLAEGLT